MQDLSNFERHGTNDLENNVLHGLDELNIKGWKKTKPLKIQEETKSVDEFVE